MRASLKFILSGLSNSLRYNSEMVSVQGEALWPFGPKPPVEYPEESQSGWPRLPRPSLIRIAVDD